MYIDKYELVKCEMLRNKSSVDDTDELFNLTI